MCSHGHARSHRPSRSALGSAKVDCEVAAGRTNMTLAAPVASSQAALPEQLLGMRVEPAPIETKGACGAHATKFSRVEALPHGRHHVR